MVRWRDSGVGVADYFISYNKADADTAWDLAEALEAAGFSVKFDKWEVGLGDDVSKWIADGLEECPQLIGLFSPEYLAPAAKYSDFERRTMLWSHISGQHGAVIPLIVRACVLPKPFATLVNHSLETESIAAFIDKLRNHPSKGRPPRPPRKSLPPKTLVYIGPDLGDRPIQGRDVELAELRAGLLKKGEASIFTPDSVKAALQGLGGIGKTGLAKLYVLTHGRDYDGIIWCLAETQGQLIDDLYGLHHHLTGQAAGNERTLHGARELVRMLATRREKWLFVYDNVSDLAAIRDLIPNAHLIVTTRLTQGWDGFAKVQPGVLPFDTPESAAVEVLLTEASIANPAPATRAAAQVVAEMLGGLPLALVMAGAVLREDKSLTLADLPARLAEVIRHGPPGLDYPDSVTGAVGLTFGRLTPDARVLADLCAWLAPEGLSEALFVGAVKASYWAYFRSDIQNDIAALLETPDRLRDALRDLRRWSVLTGAGPFEMHRLTQAVLRAGQTSGRDHAMARAAAAVLAAQFPGAQNSPSLERTWPTCRVLVPHVKALWVLADPLWQGGWGRPGWEMMDFLLHQAGVYLSTQADLPVAITFGRASLRLTETRLGADHRDFTVAIGNLAMDLAQISDPAALAEAEVLIARAVELDEAYRTGFAQADLASTCLKQASITCLRMQRDPVGRTAAAELAERALAQAWHIWCHLFGPNYVSLANVWNETGELRSQQNRKAAALAAYRMALAVTRALPDVDADRGALASVAVNAGVIALKLGRAAEALSLLREASEILEDILHDRPQHGLRVACQRWLATCLMKRAAQGDAAAREQAVALCARHGLPLAEVEARAADFPDAPLDLPPDEDWPWVRHPPDLDSA